MCLRESPRSLGPGPIGKYTLVAITTSSRRVNWRIERPSTVSDIPTEHTLMNDER